MLLPAFRQSFFKRVWIEIQQEIVLNMETFSQINNGKFFENNNIWENICYSILRIRFWWNFQFSNRGNLEIKNDCTSFYNKIPTIKVNRSVKLWIARHFNSTNCSNWCGKNILSSSWTQNIKSHLDTNCSITLIKKIIKSQILHLLLEIRFKISETLLLRTMTP